MKYKIKFLIQCPSLDNPDKKYIYTIEAENEIEAEQLAYNKLPKIDYLWCRISEIEIEEFLC